VYEHFGADEGFKADMLYFPDLHLSVIGLTNNSSFFGLQKLLFDLSDIAEGTDLKSIVMGTIPPDETEQFYYDPSQPRLLHLQNKKGISIGTMPGSYHAPYLLVGDTLQSTDPIPVLLVKKTDVLEYRDKWYKTHNRLHLIAPVRPGSDMNNYAGSYYSPELETTFNIIQKDGNLQFEFIPGVTFNLFRITETDFVFDYIGSNYLQFTRDGFEFSREGVRKLVFKRK
jgi:hypothetical protein